VGSKRGSYSSPRQQERQERVLQSARELIANRGYDGLTMRELARVSEVSDKTLYNLFATKDGLVMAAVADLLDAIVTQVQAGEQAAGLAAILRYTDAISAQILVSPEYAQAMSRALFQAEDSSPIVDLLLRSNQKFLQRQLRHAQRRGELTRKVQSARTATLLTAHTWGVLLLWNKGLLSLSSLPTMSRQSMLTSLSGVVSEQGQIVLKNWSDNV
jgi:AcrR family transcriptional regulator